MALAALWLSSAAVGVPGAETNAPLVWDARLTTLGVYLVETNVAAGTYYWRLISAAYEDETQSGGTHHIYYKTLDERGNPLENQRCFAAYPTGNPTTTLELFTKGPGIDNYWGNYPMAGNWCPFWPQGPRGPYGAYPAGPADQVWGMGLPCNRHVNYRLTWQWTAKASTVQMPRIEVAPTNLLVTATQGAYPAARFFTIRNSGGGTLDYSITNTVAWLSAFPSTGNSTGETDTVVLQFSTLNLAPGNYSASILIRDPNATNSPVALPLKVTIFPEHPVGALTEEFEVTPPWASAYDAPWGGGAGWLVASGGWLGNALRITRTNAGSSTRTLRFAVEPNANYRLRIYGRCLSGATDFWAECAYRLGECDANDFDADAGSWTMIKRFSLSGANGNGGLWRPYVTVPSTGDHTNLNVGFKLGASGGVAPAIDWDSLTITPFVPPSVVAAVAGADRRTVTVSFAEAIDAVTGTMAGNYSLIGGEDPSDVQQAVLLNASNVTLTTDALAPGASFTLTVRNVLAQGDVGTVAAANGSVELLGTVPLLAVDPSMTVWRYDITSTNLDDSWRTLDFDDRYWPMGPALLGFENSPFLPEPIRTVLWPEYGRITYYFRHGFDLPASLTNGLLRLNHLVDDGAVFYLNGAEIHRVRLTNAPVQYHHLASSASPDATAEGPFILAVTNLLSGQNVLAVEVHQNSPYSEDVVFGAALDLLVPPSVLCAHHPRLRHDATSRQMVFSWVGTNLVLESSADVGGPWQSLMVYPPYSVSLTNAARFYRLRVE